MNSNLVYLDYAATTPLLPAARTAMLAVLDGSYGNASSLHSPGHAASDLVEEARKSVAQLINAEPDEIIFTSGGSESNNTVMETFRQHRIAVSSIEHPSVIEAARARASELIELPVDQFGVVKLADVEKAVESSVDLFSIMLANNEIGTIEPISEITAAVKAHKTDQTTIWLHTDATQALGKIKIDVKSLGVDYLTISAHKIGGPIGIGALYVKRHAPFKPLIIGGHQERKHRAGTTNTAAIAGFGAAAKWCWDNWSCRKWIEVAKLRDQLKTRILQEIPYSSCNSPSAGCLPNLLNMSFRAAEGESIQLYLDAHGVVVSTGSACASGDLEPSHVLMALHHNAEIAHSSIRFSLGLDTDQKDIDQVMQVLPGIISRLQGISTIKLGEKIP